MNDTRLRLSYVGLAAAIVGAGLLCRWPALGLPWFAAKYAGSLLWGSLVYAVLRAIDPRATVSRTLMVATGIAIGVEISRLYHQPALDAFRATLAGKLLLGRHFSLWDVVAYTIGIVLVAMADQGVARPPGRVRAGKRKGAR